jgi:hypothetical protein
MICLASAHYALVYSDWCSWCPKACPQVKTYGNTIQQHTGKSYIEAKEQNRLTFQFQSIFFSTFTKNLNALQSDIYPQNLQEMDPDVIINSHIPHSSCINE